MNHNLTQPEEVDQILQSMTRGDAMGGTQSADKDRPASNRADREDKGGLGYISPYRAAYLKSHRFFGQ